MTQRMSGHYIKRRIRFRSSKVVAVTLSTDESENYRNGMGISGRITVSSFIKMWQFFRRLQTKSGIIRSDDTIPRINFCSKVSNVLYKGAQNQNVGE